MYVMWRASVSDARVSVVVASTMSLGVLLLMTTALRSQDRATPARSVSATIKLTIIDEATGQTIPARVEVLDERGQAYVADDALLVGGDCSFPQEPWQGTPQEWQTRLTSQVLDPQSNNKHFYSDGTSTLSLPRGRYRWRVLKGNEYRIAAGAFDVGDGASNDQKIKPMRWCDMAGQGWYSSESHLHIARPTADVNPSISQWMQAEDLHVVNLLQNGNSRMFFACPQYAHGKDGLYRQGDFIVAAGQENPAHPAARPRFDTQRTRAHQLPQPIPELHFVLGRGRTARRRSRDVAISAKRGLTDNGPPSAWPSTCPTTCSTASRSFSKIRAITTFGTTQ